jgi:hypothetical protein
VLFVLCDLTSAPSCSYLQKVSDYLSAQLATPEGRRLVSVYSFWRLYESLADYLAPEFRAARQRLLEKLSGSEPRSNAVTVYIFF